MPTNVDPILSHRMSRAKTFLLNRRKLSHDMINKIHCFIGMEVMLLVAIDVPLKWRKWKRERGTLLLLCYNCLCCLPIDD